MNITTKRTSGSLLRKIEEITGRQVERKSALVGIAYLLLDVSISMEGRKLADAIEGTIGFAEDAAKKNYAVGVIKFSQTSTMVCEPSRDVTQITSQLRHLNVDSATNVAPPLLMALKGFPTLPSLRRAVVLFTDGQAQDQPEAEEAAEILRKEGIDVIAIGTEDADTGFLRRIATRSDLIVSAKTQPEDGKTGIARAIRGSAGLLTS
jgi:Mg-chelatase subunit ChlD